MKVNVILSMFLEVMKSASERVWCAADGREHDESASSHASVEDAVCLHVRISTVNTERVK